GERELDRAGDGLGQPEIYGAGADQRRPGRPSNGPLRAGLHYVRDAYRCSAVHRGRIVRDLATAHQPATAIAASAPPRRATAGRGTNHRSTGQGSTPATGGCARGARTDYRGRG